MSAARHLRPPQLVATPTLESSTGHNLPTNGPIRAIQSLASIFIQMWMQINQFCELGMPIWLLVILAACHAETPTADPGRQSVTPAETISRHPRVQIQQSKVLQACTFNLAAIATIGLT